MIVVNDDDDDGEEEVLGHNKAAFICLLGREHIKRIHEGWG